MNLADKLGIIGIILTILFGIGGIAVSIYCWKHNYEKQKAHNKILQELNAVKFNSEYSFSQVLKIIQEADDKDIDISGYFNQDNTIYEDNKISKNQLISCFYNLYHNTKLK